MMMMMRPPSYSTIARIQTPGEDDGQSVPAAGTLLIEIKSSDIEKAPASIPALNPARCSASPRSGQGKGERPPTHCQLSPSGARLLASKQVVFLENTAGLCRRVMYVARVPCMCSRGPKKPRLSRVSDRPISPCCWAGLFCETWKLEYTLCPVVAELPIITESTESTEPTPSYLRVLSPRGRRRVSPIPEPEAAVLACQHQGRAVSGNYLSPDPC